MEKFLDLVKSSIFCGFLNCRRSRQKGRHFGSSPSAATIGVNGTSDVNSRTLFPAITVKSTYLTYISSDL